MGDDEWFCVRMDSWDQHIPPSIHICSDTLSECVGSKGPFGRKRTKDLIFNNSCQSNFEVEFLRMCMHICSSLHMCSGTHIRSRQMCWSHALIRTRNNCRADFQEFSPVARRVFKNVYTHLLQYTYLLKCTHLLKYTHYSPFPRR